MHARMNHSLTTRHGRHDRLMCSQAAGRQWISQTMDIFDCTSRGQLHMVLVHAAVQWFASVCCMCGRRAITRSTSHNACAARIMRWVVFASAVWSCVSPHVSEPVRAFICMDAGAVRWSRARRKSILYTQHVLSFFRLHVIWPRGARPHNAYFT